MYFLFNLFEVDFKIEIFLNVVLVNFGVVVVNVVVCCFIEENLFLFE